MMHIVVVGAGLAGVRTAEALRRNGSDAVITIVGEEAGHPYERPPLSKDILLGKTEPDAIRLVDDAKLASLRVELRPGTRATALDPARRVLTLDSGATLHYDELVIATGSRARHLPFGELDSPASGVHVMRTLTDSLALRAALADKPRVVVIGGGVIGCEVASAARALGLRVAIIDPLPVLMQRVVGDVVAGRIAAMHVEAGVTLHLGATVAGLEAEAGRVAGVRLGSGEVVPAQLVVVGVGAVPNVEWLAGSGLTIEGGVLADEYLAAVGVSAVHVVGDVARWQHRGYAETIRAEHWTAAIDHAEAVGKTLTGTPTLVDAIPYVWTDQYGRRLQIAGRIDPGDDVVFAVDETEPARRFLALFGSNGVQHAAISLRTAPLLARHRLAMSSGEAPWPPVLEAVQGTGR
jgi:NADPH-dependent 2,4-dienoyl-CoA reductase/sulfur reductase-like enzyme